MTYTAATGQEALAWFLGRRHLYIKSIFETKTTFCPESKTNRFRIIKRILTFFHGGFFFSLSRKPKSVLVTLKIVDVRSFSLITPPSFCSVLWVGFSCQTNKGSILGIILFLVVDRRVGGVLFSSGL